MSNPIRPRARLATPIAALLAVAVATLAGCSMIGASAPAIIGTGPLVTVTTRGGECMDGPCGSVVVIERDGTVHEAAKPPNELGTLSRELLTALDAAVKTADFTTIRAMPFTGECPTAFDGQEAIYEFGAPGGIERVASCETAIDPANPVFAATTAALVAVGVLAAP
jgi:hypothetical protein